ncbi:tyrosine-protein kinase RYK isoform X1 [Strongylocentrotus purpuratus]|uniref:receptor protein-tyrosine kinase n=1 Tax=Strongylocentrotus purpuratus TaxID=7668 RepID=A0A7M7SXF1_STRPU|nr:tyrosine-protein kinase RYK isoform X2 [Strongylocentrotus purpuratus]XP_788381.3 tyrosine-protein kinase RYK isoform X1 [Strongylocentrotus purpuratus]|eukprot:XP_011665107.1 PREDICTED: tyrosine-protein kinase RYK isoform X2 [Strongylocentrotus purpuratus]
MATRTLYIILLKCVVLFSCIYCVNGYMNLFISPAEVKRLVGVSAELYYIREGKINRAATNYPLAVPTGINKLYYTWYSERQVYYSMSVKSKSPRILYHPSLNITKDGKVPVKETVFEMQLECTGHEGGEAIIELQVNLTLYSASNITTLNTIRTKLCQGMPGVPIQSRDPVQREDPRPRNNNSHLVTESKVKAVTSTSVFYIAVGVVCGIILLFVLVVALIHVRTMRSSDPASSDASSTGLINGGRQPEHPNFPKIPEPKVDRLSNGNGYNSLHYQICPSLAEAEDLRLKLAPYAIERSRITLGEVLLEGTFGRVHQGVLISATGDSEQDVFIKTVTDHSSEEQRHLLVKESCLLQGLSHKNILPLLHVCFSDPPFILEAFMKLGNLKQFLKNGRIGPGDKHQAISTRDLVHLAIQITHGMMYLGKKRLVHKDLATRNCVIDEDYNLKITDNALSRDLFPSDYHCLGDNENRPVKWMAVESLVHKKFSHASDVWSFGVTLWELVTLGQTPYMDLDPFEMATFLKSGYRMPQPPSCPDELFNLMACCWALLPQDRPKFSQLCAALTDFHRTLGIYI